MLLEAQMLPLEAFWKKKVKKKVSERSSCNSFFSFFFFERRPTNFMENFWPSQFFFVNLNETFFS